MKRDFIHDYDVMWMREGKLAIVMIAKIIEKYMRRAGD
jgi:hypothetical protein